MAHWTSTGKAPSFLAGGSSSVKSTPIWQGLGALSFSPIDIASGLIIGSLAEAATSEIATRTGINSLGHKRNTAKEQNKRVANVIPGVEQMIQRFNQQPWFNGAPTADSVRWLSEALLEHGVQPGYSCWQSLIDVSAAALPLDAYMRAFYRESRYPDGTPIVTTGQPQSVLDYQIRRSMLQHKYDIELLLRPPASWSIGELVALWRRGIINFDLFRQELKASGIVRDEDYSYFLGLKASPPDVPTLMTWAMRKMWSQGLVDAYGLDEGYEAAPVPWWYARREYGDIGEHTLNGAPDGEDDWLKLAYRAGRPLPGFESALQMQYRLRPREDDPTQSVIPGIDPWLPGSTKDMLRLDGFTEPIIKQLMGLASQPVNIRIVNEVLTEAFKHPNVAADAQAAFGPNVDWAKGVFLDHGFADATAQLAADALRAKAQDVIDAEKIDERKKLRAQHRDLVLKRYAVGLISRATVLDLVVNDQYDAAMATEAMRIINESAELALAESHLAAVKEGYMAGKLSIDQVGAQMTAIGISDFMKIHYIQEWAWTRSDNPRMLATKQILAALKTGLLTPQLAMARLTNLGWTQADALVEIAQIEQEVLAASQHQQSTAAAKQIAAQMKAQRQEASAAKVAERDAAKSARAAVKAEQSAARVPLEGAVAGFTYDGKALLDFNAYNKASKAGDVAAMQAELDKATAAYAEVLLKELKLRQANPGVANEVLTAKQIVDPTTPPSAGAGKASASVPPAAGGTPAAGGGTGPASGP